MQGYGTALPADYMWLSDVYRTGAIAHHFSILAPLPASEIGVAPGVAPMSAEQYRQTLRRVVVGCDVRSDGSRGLFGGRLCLGTDTGGQRLSSVR